MTVEKDWFSYLFEPATLLVDLKNLSDGQKVSLMKQFLSQAEMHDRRTANSSAAGAVCVPDLQPQLQDTLLLPEEQQVYDKSKMLDTLALQIAASFNFHVNLFSGVVTELPLRLSSRLYRTLFLTVLAYSKDNGRPACSTTPYDLGPWESMEPLVAFTAFAYHLWCLQVAFSISLLPQPFRNMTPVVAGLQEVPDVAFLPDSRADLEAIMMRREESVARLVALSDLLQTEDRESSERSAVPLVTRPRASCFRFTNLRKPLFTDQADDIDVLPRTRLLISTNFALGRLAFQHCLIDRAAQYFHVAHENLLIEKLSCIEEVDATPPLIEAYLAACQSYLVVSPSLDSETGDAEHITQALPATRTSPVKVVEEFCEYLVRELSRSADDTDFLSLSTFDSPTKQTLRISPSRAPPKDKRGSSKARKVSRSSLDALLDILRQDVQLNTSPDLDQYSTSCTVPLGVGPRFRTEQLTFAALRRLAGICRSRHSDPKGGTVSKSKARAKDLTMLRNLFLEWKTFYSKLVVSNSINAILIGSGFLSSPLIDELLATSAHIEESSGGDFAFTAVLDQDVAVEYLFDELSSLLQSLTAAATKAAPSQLFLHAKAQITELLHFVGHLLVSVAQRSPVDVAASADDIGPATRLMATTEAVLSSTLFEQLPESLRSFVQSTTTKLTSNPNLQRGTPSHLPDPAAPCAPFWPEDAPLGGGSSQSGGNAFPYNQQQQQDVDMRCVAATNRQSLPLSANDLATCRALLTSSDPTHIIRAAEEFLSFGWLSFDLLRQDAAWLPALLNLLRFSTPPAGFAFPAPQPLNDMPPMASGRRGFLSQADSQAGGSGSPGSGFISLEPAHQQQQHLAELFASALTDQPPWCINALLLLAQAIVSRQHRLDLSTAHLLCCAALRQLPPNMAAAGVRDRPSASPVLWMRSLPRWLRSALDHELFLLDLLETSCAPSPSIARRPGFNLDRAELVGRAKSLLLQAAGLSNDLGPDALISDELVAACACLLLLVGDYNFLTPRSPPAGPGELALPPAVFPMPASGFPALGPLEILRALMRLHYEVLAAVTGNGPTNGEEKETKQPASDRSPLTAAAHDLCFLLLGQKCLTGREPSAPSFAPASSMESAGATWGMTPFGQSRWRPKDCPGGVSESSLGNGSGPANTSATLSGNSAGGGGSNPPSAAVSFESFAFLVWLLANCEPHPGSVSASDQREQEQHQQLQIHPLHNLLDCLLTCLTALLDILAPSFTPGWDFHLGPKLFLEHASTAVLPDNTDIGVFEQSPLGWRDIWPTSLPPASSKISPTTLYRLLDFCLDRAITRTPWRPDWLLLKADLEFAAATSNGVPPRNVLSLLLEAGMVTSNFFSQPVPPSLYTERVVRLMVECCQSMGLIGEAVVLCQLAPNRSLLKLGVRLIESMCSGTSVPPESNGPNGPPAADDVAGRGNNQQPRPATSLDALDSLTDYIWELDLLEALANLEHERGSLSKRTKYLECINQPELSTCNASEIVELTQVKRTSEFLRFLARTYLV